jgi:hypothetical protein
MLCLLAVIRRDIPLAVALFGLFRCVFRCAKPTQNATVHAAAFRSERASPFLDKFCQKDTIKTVISHKASDPEVIGVLSCGIARKDLATTIPADQEHIISFTLIFWAHSRRPIGHARNSETDSIWPFSQQAADVGNRHVPFDHVTLNLARVARYHSLRDAVVQLVTHHKSPKAPLLGNAKALLPKNGDPGATAAAIWVFDNVDCWCNLRKCRKRRGAGNASDGGQNLAARHMHRISPFG